MRRSKCTIALAPISGLHLLHWHLQLDLVLQVEECAGLLRLAISNVIHIHLLYDHDAVRITARSKLLDCEVST